MPANSINIIDATSHPDDSTVEVIYGTEYKGDGFYGRTDGMHTVQVSLAGFKGKIELQGTLETNPTQGDWATIELGTGVQSVDTTGLIAEENITTIQYDTDTTNNKTYNFVGNFVWVRAFIYNWTKGTINYIKLNH